MCKHVLIVQSPSSSSSIAAAAHYLIGHNSKGNTYKTSAQLLGCHVGCDQKRKLYTHELVP